MVNQYKNNVIYVYLQHMSINLQIYDTQLITCPILLHILYTLNTNNLYILTLAFNLSNTILHWTLKDLYRLNMEYYISKINLAVSKLHCHF